MKKFVWYLMMMGWVMSANANANANAGAANFTKFEQLVEALEQKDKAMLGIAIRQDGQLIFEKYTGLASLSPKVASGREFKYRFGSVSKLFTATMTMRAVEQEKLNLSDKLSQFFPGIPNAKRISIRQLLSHRSGIFNFTDSPDYPNYMTQAKTRKELLAIVEGYPPVFTPGERHEYSNSNYLLLSLILERVYNKNLAELLNEQVARPLGLEHTYLGGSGAADKHEVASFRYLNGWQTLPATDLSIPLGAGGIVSTASDISLFLTGLFEGRLVSPDTLSQMTKLEEGYGLGFMAFPFHQKLGLGHGGAIDGFLSNAAYIEEDKLAISVISNGLNYNFNDVLIALLSSYYGKEFEIPNFDLNAIELSESELARYSGEFVTDALPLDIRVFVESGKLMGQATGQQAFDLTPFSELEFRFDPAGIVMTFNEDKTEFILAQGGGQFLFTKK